MVNARDTKKRGQSMSFDAIAATFLFILIAVFGAVYAFNFFSADIGPMLTNEANAMADRIIRDLGARADGTDRIRIDERRLIALIDQVRHDPNYLRNELGMRSDYCVFFEDEDGTIATVVVSEDGDIDVARAYFGSSRVYLNVTGDGSGRISCSP